MNRTGSVIDAAYLLPGFLIFGLIAIVGLLLVTNLNAAFAPLAGEFPAAAHIMDTAATQYPDMMDFWFVMLFIGAPLVAAVLAYFNNIHPFFFWISLLFTLFLVIFGKALQMVWESVLSDATLEAAATAMPMMNYILTNYGFYSFIVVVLITIGTFIKLGNVQRDVIGGV